MNAKLKNSMIIACAIAIIGLILAIIGFVMGGMQGISVSADGVKISSVESNAKQLNETYSNINAIDADVDIRDIILKQGTEFKVESKGVGENFIAKVENNKLYIREEEPTKFHISFINFGFFTGKGEYEDLIITYPANTSFQDINIESDSGIIKIGNAKISKLNLDADLGDIVLDNLRVDSLFANLSSGKLLLDKVHADTFKFEMDLGDMEAIDFSGRKIQGDSDSGSVKLIGTVTGPINIDSDLGDVDLRLNGKENQYSYELKVDLGTITLNGKETEGAITTIYDNKPLININNDSGDIDISFR